VTSGLGYDFGLVKLAMVALMMVFGVVADRRCLTWQSQQTQDGLAKSNQPPAVRPRNGGLGLTYSPDIAKSACQ